MSSSADESELRNLCPRCKRWFPLEVERCPEHDLALVAARPPKDSLIGKVLAGRYHIDGILGSGGMGTVYTAVQEPIGRTVAVKVLRREFTEDRTVVSRFYNEAKAASALANPNTITIHDFGETEDGTLYIAMERLEGLTLASKLEKGALEIAHAVEIAAQVCRALSDAHRKGIVHRDLKPENIMLCTSDDGSLLVKVLDFGIAKMLRSFSLSSADKPETRAGRIVGTPRYMSPEQARGEKPTTASDLYALGVILYEMLTGQPPFDASKAVLLLGMHIKDEAPPVVSPFGEVPRPVIDLVGALLAKSPEARPGSAEKAASVLRSLRPEGEVAASAVLKDHSAATVSLRAPEASPAAASPKPPGPAEDEPAEDAGPKWTTEIDEVPAWSTAPTAEVDEIPSWSVAPTMNLDRVQDEARAERPSQRAVISSNDPIDELPVDKASTEATGLDVVRGRRSPALLLLALAVVVVLVGGVYVGLRSSAPVVPAVAPDSAPSLPAQRPEAGQPEPSPPPLRPIALTSVPPGASVQRGDEYLCETPCRTSLPAGVPQQLRFHLRGYRITVVEVVAGQSEALNVELQALDSALAP